MEGYTIVICTHNPDQKIIERLFAAIKKFDLSDGINLEVIIADSNSSQQLASENYVKKFLAFNSEFKILRVNKSGLTNARIEGIRCARYPWVIFFDDDNEPDVAYLQILKALTKRFPDVRVWGPGKIKVEFDGVSVANKFTNSKRELFQERDLKSTNFDNNSNGSEYFPPGSGMVIHIDVLRDYHLKVSQYIYTMTDRNGKNLTSGGDVQIILNAVRMGYYAGSSHLLKLNHIIKKERLKLGKITKLQYWLSSSYKKAYNEIFPDNAFEISYISNKQIFSLIYYHIKVVLFKYGYKEAVFRFYARLGELNSNVIASNQTRRPALLKFFENLIR